MNMQEIADKCEKKFLEKIEEKMGDSSIVPLPVIKRYCRMLTIYCDSEGKVTESFIKSMEKCIEEIKSVEGMDEIFDECNQCPED
ncbi:hypothetical protein MN086_04940 [Sulfurovum sp. XGS-02]|uniref:hypothetical protein n=1 Tax=Sulfurovum sp. XGS-02 TaxID=2925411 RepID=UPI002063E636|nr:hypothetical protein [Sulfurovum sp. XGS-02]UPT78495.1 hypothetical protein MN086_04940 [Sulfurovum sp. XGS-02]